MLLKRLLLLSAGLLNITGLAHLPEMTFFCRQNPLFTGSRAASLDQGASDCKKEADLRAVFSQELTLCPPTRAVISASLFSSSTVFDLGSHNHTTGFPVMLLFAMQGNKENTNSPFKNRKKIKGISQTQPQELCKVTAVGLWIILTTLLP